MAWLERHDPWIDWRSKTLGATHFSPGGALANHEPTSARTQKPYWREHWTESVSVLDVGVSEMMHTTDVGAVLPEVGSTSHTSAGPERRSLDVCGAAGTLLNTGRLSPGDFTSRPIGRNPDVASKAGRNSPCVSWSGDGRVGVSPLVPSPAADGASAPGRGDGDIAMSPSSTRSRPRRRREEDAERLRRPLRLTRCLAC
ncbi:hypothetical protein PF003_g36967 [Phytophthora fragariae]|nr:hypothetical protein PF003_g36967 [Phytophthora fragariae]